MRLTRASLGLALLVAATLFVVWPASGRQQGPAPETMPVQMLGTGSADSLWSGARPRDPELAKMIDAEVKAQQDVTKLTAAYGRTEGEDARSKVKEKLSAALVKQFDAQQKRRELELSRVEAQVKKLRALMKKRDEERKTIIDKRLDQLIREADGLGWSPPPALRPGGFGNYSSARPREQ